MTRSTWALLGTLALGVAFATNTGAQRAAVPGAVRPATAHAQAAAGAKPPTPAPQTAATPAAVTSDPNAIVGTYCLSCHNDKAKRGDLTLQTFELARVSDVPDVGEKMIRKLQAGMMPPPGYKRPDPVAYQNFINALETRLDAVAAAKPNPGTKVFTRLNRKEYQAAVKELVGIEVDAGAWLPLDQMSANFDNIADEQAMSATSVEAYLNAATEISRLAVGDRNAPKVDRTYNNTSYASQHPWDHLEGAPYGTRGGLVVNHVFPADGEYSFEVTVNSGDNSRFEDIDVSLNGERLALLRFENGETKDADGRGAISVFSEKVFVKAGQHKMAAAFVRRFDGPYEDLIRPHDWSYAGGGSGGTPITTLPGVRDLVIRGPFKTTGVSETASRQRIFTCRPLSAADERPCAKQIVSRLGMSAYRRPMTPAEVDKMMQFYDVGAAKNGGFEAGVTHALEAILASPYFIFRMEKQPATVKAGMSYKVSDIDLASRLSFFLWGAPPDKDLLALATSGQLSNPVILEKTARKMLADPRAEALGTRFAGQWLRLQDIEKVHPDPNFFPNFDDNLAEMMRTETKMFFNNLVKEDRSVLDLYRADFTFANDRLARHYGFPDVAGSQFRKVAYPDNTRRGLLGQGSMLVQSSYANRTSAVLRGKWVMEVLLGTPPPPPPQDGSVPAFEKSAETANGKILTTRERMELHRVSPSCNSCHKFIDPIGLALDNFDVTGKWRLQENGNPLDTRGDFYDGTPISTPAELSAVLLKRPIPLVRTFTENLLAYALGRRSEYYDMPTIRAIQRSAAATDYKISSFIVGVIMSDAFRMKRADVAPAADSKTAAKDIK